jgi:hypothetical protein
LKIAGLLLLLAGCALVLSALVLLNSLPSRMGFVLAGIAVEILVFVLLARSHIPAPKRRGDV